jgi:putative FmdB family regulatory protein
MPIYEYICRSCDDRFELLVRGQTKVQCPNCLGDKLEKQLSVFAAATKSGADTDFAAASPCGQCGDPRGPGSCELD